MRTPSRFHAFGEIPRSDLGIVFCVRLAFSWFLVCAVALACAQSDQPYREATRLIKPQLTIVVKPGTLGADLVRATALDDDYPTDLLVEQLQRIGENAGSPTRGIQVAQNPATGNAFPSATCAVVGLVDARRGLFWLEPIVKAFAGAPEEHRIEGLHVTFEGVKPSEQALSQFANESVAVFGSFSFLGGSDGAGVPVLDYRIAIRNQDVKEITIPTSTDELKPSPEPSVPVARPPNWGLIGTLIAVGALSAGALVYFLLLGSGGSKARSSVSRRS